MLAELIRHDYSFPFGEARIKLRYSLAAFLELEKQGIIYSDIFFENLPAVVVIAFFKAGLTEKLPEKTVGEIVECVGVEVIWEYCRAAMEKALPKKDPLIIPDLSKNAEKNGEFSFVRLRTLIVDIMRKSEEFFWSSTLAELLERWQEYAYAMGYAKPPEKVQMTDTEGM